VCVDNQDAVVLVKFDNLLAAVADKRKARDLGA
jgi:hypothetical protein